MIQQNRICIQSRSNRPYRITKSVAESTPVQDAERPGTITKDSLSIPLDAI
jgi:hypothetical protein